MPANQQYTVVGIGELLWDLLPSGAQLGGAPANFAYWSAVLGDHSAIVSRVGDDELGHKAVDFLKRAGIETDYIQLDGSLPTGTVQVELDRGGQPAFEITSDVAWEALESAPGLQVLAASADAICFGTLALRSIPTRETITRFIAAARRSALIVFDLNLRQSFYSRELIIQSLEASNIVKMNSQELPVVTRLLDIEARTEQELCRRLLDRYRLRLVCITRGHRGSLIVTASETVEHAGFTVGVVDTVGSGDAFTAALVHHLLKGSSLERISEAANRLGAWTAARAGAMPTPDDAILDGVL